MRARPVGEVSTAIQRVMKSRVAGKRRLCARYAPTQLETATAALAATAQRPLPIVAPPSISKEGPPREGVQGIPSTRKLLVPPIIHRRVCYQLPYHFLYLDATTISREFFSWDD